MNEVRLISTMDVHEGKEAAAFEVLAAIVAPEADSSPGEPISGAGETAPALPPIPRLGEDGEELRVPIGSDRRLVLRWAGLDPAEREQPKDETVRVELSRVSASRHTRSRSTEM